MADNNVRKILDTTIQSVNAHKKIGGPRSATLRGRHRWGVGGLRRNFVKVPNRLTVPLLFWLSGINYQCSG